MKFKILEGTATQDKRRYKAGDVIENDSDLRRRFNRRNSKKFELVKENTPVSPGVPLNAPEEPVAQVDLDEEPVDVIEESVYDEMSVAELQEEAKTLGVKVAASAKKAEIIAALKAASEA